MNTNLPQKRTKSNPGKDIKQIEPSPSFNTLAQLATKANANEFKKAFEGLCESELDSENFDIQSLTTKDDKKALIKRARRKYFTVGILKALVDASRLNEKSTLRKPYWNSYHCAKALTLSSDGKISGRYCKNRWCMVCNSIRTAQLIHEYLPVLKNWEDKHLVTLTVSNCSAGALPAQLNTMKRDFNTVYKRLGKQYQRKQQERFKGLRKLECTYNVERNDFHPHFHIIVEGANNAQALHDYWLQSTFLTDAKGQDVRKADEAAVMELFKYFTKVISGKSKDGRMIYADALDVVFNAVKGIRTFQSFGLDEADKDALSEARQQLRDAAANDESIIAVDSFEWAANDWFSIMTGEALTNYDPGEAMKALVEVKTVVRKTWDKTPREYTGKPNEAATPGARLPTILKPPIDPKISAGTAHRARLKAGVNPLKDREILIIPFI